MLEFLETEIVIKTEAEKILKYKDLTIEIQRMSNVKAKVIPVIIDWNHFKITQTVPETNVPGKHEIKELPKKQPYWTLDTHCGKC